MTRKTVHVPGVSEAIEAAGVPLVAATRGQGLVFVSGMPPLDPDEGGFLEGSIREQTDLAMRNVERCLAAAGVSLDDVLKVRIYGPAEAYAAINEVYAGFFDGDPPARTFVPVPDLPIPADLEIECVASA